MAEIGVSCETNETVLLASPKEYEDGRPTLKADAGALPPCRPGAAFLDRRRALRHCGPSAI